MAAGLMMILVDVLTMILVAVMPTVVGIEVNITHDRAMFGMPVFEHIVKWEQDGKPDPTPIIPALEAKQENDVLYNCLVYGLLEFAERERLASDPGMVPTIWNPEELKNSTVTVTQLWHMGQELRLTNFVRRMNYLVLMLRLYPDVQWAEVKDAQKRKQIETMGPAGSIILDALAHHLSLSRQVPRKNLPKPTVYQCIDQVLMNLQAVYDMEHATDSAGALMPARHEFDQKAERIRQDMAPFLVAGRNVLKGAGRLMSLLCQYVRMFTDDI